MRTSFYKFADRRARIEDRRSKIVPWPASLDLLSSILSLVLQIYVQRYIFKLARSARRYDSCTSNEGIGGSVPEHAAEKVLDVMVLRVC
jgi:hypothetical protein